MESAKIVAGVLATIRPFLKTVAAAVSDTEIRPVLELFGTAGDSNVHYSARRLCLTSTRSLHDNDVNAA
ncbi:MAG: hypothetical protein MUQ25_13810 [Candidatus Aminicenantes bacterium]|nr:hypothetical protein [Candidatus Aminicenantes bacterium]